jgi:hypothetical protein
MLLDRSDAARIDWHGEDEDTQGPDAKPMTLRKDAAGRQSTSDLSTEPPLAYRKILAEWIAGELRN